jgi:hypothetical protein
MAFSSYNSRISSPATGQSGFLPGDITQISFSGFSAAEIDVTQLTSAAKSYIMGTNDPGTFTVTTMVNAAAANKPPVPVSNGTASSYTVYFGGASTTGLKFIFSAFLTGTALEAAVDGAVQATYTLQITGAVTVSYTAP